MVKNSFGEERILGQKDFGEELFWLEIFCRLLVIGLHQNYSFQGIIACRTPVRGPQQWTSPESDPLGLPSTRHSIHNMEPPAWRGSYQHGAYLLRSGIITGCPEVNNSFLSSQGRFLSGRIFRPIVLFLHYNIFLRTQPGRVGERLLFRRTTWIRGQGNRKYPFCFKSLFLMRNPLCGSGAI